MKSSQFQLNLVSLADILTNSVGMLILFAIICMLQGNSRTFTEHVPLMHDTVRSPVYFLCKADSIVYLDPQTIAVRAFERSASGNADGQFSLGYLGLLGRWQGLEGLEVWPKDTTAWTGVEGLTRKGSEIRSTLEHIDPERQYGFFYVADEPLPSGLGSGFATFAAAKAILHARGVQLGWMPFEQAHPPLLCTSDRCLRQRRPSSL